MSEMFGTVETVEWLAPSMVRIVFGGEGLASFVSSGSADQYVNAQFLPPESPLEVPFGDAAAQHVRPINDLAIGATRCGGGTKRHAA